MITRVTTTAVHLVAWDFSKDIQGNAFMLKGK
jgi:hypothetical protein